MLHWVSKKIKYTFIILLVVFAILQFVGPERPATSTENPGDILQVANISPEISNMLKSACYDCHSMETKYPWYGFIAPVSWFLYGHIDHGREELNFSNWTSLDKRGKLRALKDIQEVLEEGEMPLSSYVGLHEEADLTDAQKEALMAWAKEFAGVVIKE